MKTLKAFRLSEEACSKLDAQPNATQYLEDLILNKQDSDLSELFNKQTQELKLFIKSQSKGTSSELTPTHRPVYSGKYLVGNEEVQPKDCLCRYERDERGFNERVSTSENCPIHGDLTNFEDLL